MNVESLAALIDKNANISNGELAYYFANYNNSSAILDTINLGENVFCGYNSDFKEYGVIFFELNGSRQVVPNCAVPKMNTSTMPGICAANNFLVLSNKSYHTYLLQESGKTINVYAKIKLLNDIKWIEIILSFNNREIGLWQLQVSITAVTHRIMLQITRTRLKKQLVIFKKQRKIPRWEKQKSVRKIM